MQLKLYGTLREKRYNWFFKCIIYVSLHNDFLRQKNQRYSISEKRAERIYRMCRYIDLQKR